MKGGGSARRRADNIAKEILDAGYEYNVDPAQGTYRLEQKDTKTAYKAPLGGVAAGSTIFAKNRRLKRMVGEQLAHRAALANSAIQTPPTGDANTNTNTGDADKAAQDKARQDSKDNTPQKMESKSVSDGMTPKGVDAGELAASRKMEHVTPQQPDTQGPKITTVGDWRSHRGELPTPDMAEVTDPFMKVPNAQARKYSLTNWLPNAPEWMGRRGEADYLHPGGFFQPHTFRDAITGDYGGFGDQGAMVDEASYFMDNEEFRDNNRVMNPNYEEGLIPYDNTARDYWQSQGYDVQPIVREGANGTDYYYKVGNKTSGTARVMDFVGDVMNPGAVGTKFTTAPINIVDDGLKAIGQGSKAIGQGQKAISGGQKAITQGQNLVPKATQAIEQGASYIPKVQNTVTQATKAASNAGALGTGTTTIIPKTTKAIGQGTKALKQGPIDITRVGQKAIEQGTKALPAETSTVLKIFGL